MTDVEAKMAQVLKARFKVEPELSKDYAVPTVEVWTKDLCVSISYFDKSQDFLAEIDLVSFSKKLAYSGCGMGKNPLVALVEALRHVQKRGLDLTVFANKVTQ